MLKRPRLFARFRRSGSGWVARGRQGRDGGWVVPRRPDHPVPLLAVDGCPGLGATDGPADLFAAWRTTGDRRA